jgi:hypothetical protein
MEFERPAVMFVHGLPLVRDPLKNWVTYCRSAVIEARAAPVCFGYSRWTGWAALLRPGGKVAARLAREFLRAHSGGARDSSGHRPQYGILPRRSGAGGATQHSRLPRGHSARINCPAGLRLGECDPTRSGPSPVPSQ